MKHILNNLTELEKNSIREQHTGGMKVMVEAFSKLLNSKLGDVRPISEQAKPNSVYKVGQILKANRSTDKQNYTIKIIQIVPDGTNVSASITGPGEYNGKSLDGRNNLELNAGKPGELSGNMQLGTFTIVK